jgi:enoyl-CoA hydratase/carnithine racemase
MKPVHIAIWNGYVFGSGAGICMRALFTIATDNTEWAMPENVAGFIPDNGSSRFFANIRNCDLPIGLYLAITGARVTGKNILKFGICTHFVPKGKLDVLEQELISNVKKTTSKEEINTIINKYADISLAKSYPDNYSKI